MIEAATNIISQIISYSSIYALASLGIVISGRAGIFNISAEGIMLTAASAGFSIALLTQNWILGCLVGIAAGGLFGFIFISFHERFRVDQFVLGISLIIAGAASSDLIDKAITAHGTVIAKAPTVLRWSVPGLAQIPLIGGFFDQNVLTYFMYLCIFAAFRFLYRTKRGLEVRSIGENPKAADVVGIPVLKTRYAAAIVGAAFMGLAGVYLPLVVTGAYSTGMVAGRGFMTIGIAIFASWKPQRVLPSALIFATFEVIAFQLQLFVPQQQYIFLVQTLPFAGVLILMMIFKKHVEFPTSLGAPYLRE